MAVPRLKIQMSIFLLLISLLLFTHQSASCEDQQQLRKREEEEFSEELLLKPLPDRKILSHFYFQTTAPPTLSYGPHHRLFPKAIYQLVHKFRIREMELSFTQGRWNYDRWGSYDPISSNNAKPPGVELWASFDVPQHEVDSTWKNLTHALSGLFCASINFLDDSTSYTSPEWGFRGVLGNLRYGTLPREAVCTENLTPWLKLLPCRDKAGISSLMDRPSIYRGFYHSQRLYLTSAEFNPTALDKGIVLEQTLTVVLQPHTLGKLQPSWSLSSLFGRKIGGKCVLAKSSNVYLQLEGDLLSQMSNSQMEYERDNSGSLVTEDSFSHPGFEVSVSPHRLIKELDNLQKVRSVLYEFLVEEYSDSKPFDLGLTWRTSMVWSCPQAPLHASRFLMGSGNERGAIAISLKPTRENIFRIGDNKGDACSLKVHVFQVVPWYVKVYYHTLKLYIDGQPQSISDSIKKMRVSPSKDKVCPGVMEMVFQLPCAVKSAALTVEFDKGFLHIDEYPPDANQGFDIPSAIVSFPDFETSLDFLDGVAINNSQLLYKLQEKSPVLSYTEVLLVPLTTPDFSMPYNVITITCTVFALYFGSLLNAIRRRIGEEERLLKERATKKNARFPLLSSKLYAKLRGRPYEPQHSPSASSSMINSKLLIKIALVAGLAAGWQYYFS